MTNSRLAGLPGRAACCCLGRRRTLIGLSLPVCAAWPAPAGVLGEAPSDSFDRKLLEEPLEKVQQVLQEARRIHGL